MVHDEITINPLPPGSAFVNMGITHSLSLLFTALGSAYFPTVPSHQEVFSCVFPPSSITFAIPLPNRTSFAQHVGNERELPVG
jgi:hypothetical protein